MRARASPEVGQVAWLFSEPGGSYVDFKPTASLSFGGVSASKLETEHQGQRNPWVPERPRARTTDSNRATTELAYSTAGLR